MLQSDLVIQNAMHCEICVLQAKAVEALHASVEIEGGWSAMCQRHPTLIPDLSGLRGRSMGMLCVN